MGIPGNAEIKIPCQFSPSKASINSGAYGLIAGIQLW